MPFIDLNINKNLFFWKIDENIDELYNQVNLSEEEQQIYNSFKAQKRQLEFLSTRCLLQRINKNWHIHYNNKVPFIPNSEKYISISHSGNLACIYLENKKILGIDIQLITNKVIKTKDKFTLMFENNGCLNELNLNIIWSVKETIYKAFSTQDLNFKEQIFVEHIDFENNIVLTLVNETSLKVNFKLLETDFILTYY